MGLGPAGGQHCYCLAIRPSIPEATIPASRSPLPGAFALDWESSEEVYWRRVNGLCGSMGIPIPQTVFYRQLSGRLTAFAARPVRHRIAELLGIQGAMWASEIAEQLGLGMQVASMTLRRGLDKVFVKVVVQGRQIKWGLLADMEANNQCL